MIKHGFDMYNVFLSAPGDLEKERETCRGAISDVNAAAAMPSKILLVTVGLTNDVHIVDYREWAGISEVSKVTVDAPPVWPRSYRLSPGPCPG